AERLSGALNELAGEELVRAHHGSLAREQRLLIEDALKAGQLPAMVATSSLELGIDMGAIDLVIQVEAPPSVASGLQRIGRAGHQIGVPSKGIIIPKFRGDLLACATLTERMRAGAVESLRYPRNPLDILAQQIVAMASLDEWHLDDLEAVIHRSAPFTELSRGALEGVLDMLSGRYPSDEFAELRPRITWDRLAGSLKAREGARKVAVTNSGTIPDRGLYGVFLVGGDEARGRGSARVGELDEEMVFETHVGDTFVLGASTWKVEEITHDRVLVSPAPGMPGKMPFWHGDSASRPLEFGRAIGALSRTLRELMERGGPPTDGVEPAARHLMEHHDLTEGAARNLLQYLRDQLDAAGALPDDRTIVVERYMDEMGDWRVCILSPFGGKVHGPWAMAIGAMIRERTDLEMDIVWTDDGIVVRLPESDEPPPIDAVIPDPDEVEDLVIRQLAVGGGGARAVGTSSVPTALFASRFREAAARALLLPRKHAGQRAPLWQQRKRAADLLHATAQYGAFPIILETYRECLRDIFDIPALVQLLREIRRRDIRTVAVTSKSPSPFAASLMFNYVTNFMYEGDAPMAERRAQALMIDQSRLRDLLGEIDLRELLDGDALEALELDLQHLAEDRRARHADGLHDLLIRLGDLSHAEMLARCADQEAAPAWITGLERERRILPLSIGGETRYIAGEDMGRYRDALGIPPPPGLPAAFLEHVRSPLGDLTARYARTHGPFTAGAAAARFGLGIGPILTVLQGFEGSGKVVQGEFRPGGAGQEWCDAGVLRQIRQRSLARLRHQVEPVEPATLGRFYVEWQGLTGRRRGADALHEVIEQLPIPTTWTSSPLPAP
ncbi:MAG: putative ATP-dependent helicase lhr, partial [Armatimonadetes bacterium]|nr:putative ATP-dependent helicase lhr [Armatimonadota bacterium]